MTRHLHDGRESCHAGQKSDLFRGIWLSEEFMYFKKVFFKSFLVPREIYVTAKLSDRRF